MKMYRTMAKPESERFPCPELRLSGVGHNGGEEVVVVVEQVVEAGTI